MDTNQGVPPRIGAFLCEVHELRFERGLTQREIAAKFGVSRNQIQKAIRDWDVHEQYYTKQHTFFRIAGDLNLTVKTLRGIFRRHGWQMRVQTERKKLSNGEIRRLHYEEGLTFVEIVKRSGLDLDIIRKAIGVRKEENTVREIGRLYFQEGLTFVQISEHLGVNLKTIRRAFGTQLDPNWVHHLYYIEGFSQQEIAALSSVHCDTIQKLFWEQGWIPRDKQKPKAIGDIDLERRKYQKKRRQNLKDARARIFGTKCYACHSEKNPIEKSLHLHLKDGTEHDRNLFRTLKRLESLNPDDWAPLCDRCHLGIHMLMKVFGFDWTRIEIFLERRKKASGTPKETLNLPDEDTPISKEFEKLGPDFEGTIDDLRKVIFGEACALCGCESKGISLTLHRKDGKTHHPSMTSRKKHLQKLNPTEWAHVCHDCHNIAQWALDKLGIEWSELFEIQKTK
jgi:transcriptional regulator with XRE-family HTH domain